jgi:dynein assembly factor with WDR repeat domains 1
MVCWNSTDVEALVDELTMQEPLLTDRRRPQLYGLLDKLIAKLADVEKDEYGLLKVMKSHILPLTNIDFDKSGSKFVTGSYDRRCVFVNSSLYGWWT